MLEALVGPTRSETHCEFHNWALTCFDTNSFLGQVRCCLLHGRFVKFICHNSERCLLPQPYISMEQLRGFSGSRKHINFHPPISRHWMFRIDGLSPCDIMQLYSGTTTSCRDPCKDRASTHQCNGSLLPWQVQQTNCASSRRISPASVIDTRSPWDLRSVETWFGSEGGFGKGPARQG